MNVKVVKDGRMKRPPRLILKQIKAEESKKREVLSLQNKKATKQGSGRPSSINERTERKEEQKMAPGYYPRIFFP